MVENRRENHTVHKFWSRGYFVATVGRDEEVIGRYIRHQEAEERKVE